MEKYSKKNNQGQTFRKLIGCLFAALILCSHSARSQKANKALTSSVAKKNSDSQNLNFKIEKISVEGTHRIEKDAILEKMSLQVGSLVSKDLIRENIKSIFSLGFFEDVRFFEREAGHLIVQVRERPVVIKISFEGQSEFDVKDLEEAISFKSFNVLNLTKIRQSALDIAKKYEEKGFYLAKADYEIITNPERSSEVEVKFRITENEAVRVRKVFFKGNEKFTSSELKQTMITTEGHIFSFMTQGGTYREQAFERDLAVLAYFYGNEGYIQAKFAKPRVTLSQDRRYIDIFIDVDEGQKFVLGQVRFQGDTLFTPEDLRNSFQFKESDTFSTGKLQEEILRVTDKFGDEGYAFANVIPRPLIREGTNIVDLAIDLERGEKVYWGKITITGNSKTHDKVIRRELPFVEGELYNATKRKRGVEKVRRLGFFGNEVNFLTATPTGKTDIIDLEIKVTEKPTGSLNLSAGYGSGVGFTLRGQVSQANLFGRGQFLAVTLTYEKASRQFDLQFTDPKAFDTQWLMGTDLYYQTSSVGGTGYNRTYDQELGGAAFRFGRELTEDTMLFGTYKLARSQILRPISDRLFQDPGSESDRDYMVSSLTGSLSYDSRNNRLDPFDGEYASISGEFAGLGGRVFQKFALMARMYRRPIWKFTFRTNIEFGFLTNFMTDALVPLTERYVMGYYSLRGYPLSSVGPAIDVIPTRDDVPAEARISRNYVVGGTKKLLMTQEIEFPIIPEADIRGVLFFDAGNSWDNLSERSPALLTNYGWGFRWYSPLGPLRIEFGYPLSTVPGKTSRSPEFIFAIQPPF